jgi:hypothetical protein
VRRRKEGGEDGKRRERKIGGKKGKWDNRGLRELVLGKNGVRR